MLNDYYFDEFLAMLDEYNALHNIDKKDDEVEVVNTDKW